MKRFGPGFAFVQRSQRQLPVLCCIIAAFAECIHLLSVFILAFAECIHSGIYSTPQHDNTKV